MTSKKAILKNSGAQLTFLPEASHASHTVSRESEKVKMTSATSGPKCLEQFERFSRVGSWAKMFAGLLIGTGEWYSTRCRLTWKLRGTKSSRFYFQLVPLMRPTDETESGLLPTPVVSRSTYQHSNGDKNKKTLTLRGRMRAGLLPTPTTRDHKGARTAETLHESGRNQTNSLPDFFAQSGKTSQLNPLFVQEMMGFPPNWTELPFLSGAKNL